MADTKPTKKEIVYGMLRRPEGVTVDEAVEATGWKRASVHVFLASAKPHGVEFFKRENGERARRILDEPADAVAEGV